MSRLALCLAFCTLTATPLTAQVRAEDLWSAFQRRADLTGWHLDGELHREGSIVGLVAITARLDLPADLGSLTLTMPEVILSETGDGAIVATLPLRQQIGAELTLRIEGQPFTVSARLELTHRGYETHVAGTPSDLVLSTAADRLELALLDVRTEPSLTGEDAVRIAGVFGVEDLRSGSEWHFTDGLSLVSFGRAPRSYGELRLTGQGLTTVAVNESRELDWYREVTIPAGGLDLNDPGTALRAGFLLTSRMTNGPTLSQTEVRRGDLVQSSELARTTGNEAEIRLSATGLDTRLDVLGPDIRTELSGFGPLSLGFSADELHGRLALPLLASDSPQPARLELAMLGGDPSALLDMIFGQGRADGLDGVIDLDLALGAEITPRQDLVSLPGVIDSAMAERIIAELNSLTLERFHAAYSGARAEAEGHMDLVWSGITDFDDLREPSGHGRLLLEGVNDLLTRVSQLGLLSTEEMLAVRAGLAMAGRPTGPDRIEGEVRFGPEIGFVLNGVRLD